MRYLICILFLTGITWADQITLTNGDRVTGSVIRSDTKTLVLKTENAGELTFKWESIAAISAPGPLYIGLGGGQMIVGSVETVNGRFSVTTQNAGVVVTSKESVEF